MLKKKHIKALKENERLTSLNKTYLSFNLELQIRVQNMAASSTPAPRQLSGLSTNVRHFYF